MRRDTRGSNQRPTAQPAYCALSGELDLASAEDIRRAGWAAIKVAGPDMVIDMSGVTFLDCNGLDALIELRDQVRAGGGHLTLVGATRQVQRLLDLTRVADSFGCEQPTVPWSRRVLRRLRANPVEPVEARPHDRPTGPT